MIPDGRSFLSLTRRPLYTDRISAIILIGLIFSVLTEALFPSTALRNLSRGLLLAYLALEWRGIQRNGRVMLAIAGTITLAAVATGAEAGAAGRALDQGAFFATFFANQFFLREPARSSALVRRCASFFIDQPPARRYGLLTIGGYLFGIILNLGVLSLLGLMIRQRNSLASAGGHDEVRSIRERRMLLPLLRGFSVTPLGSPLSIAMAVLLAVLPGLEWVELLLLGLTTAGILLTFGWVLDRITAPRHLAHLVPPPRGQRDPAALAGLVVLVLSVFGLAIIIESAATLPLNRAVLVALPVAGMVWLAWQYRHFRPVTGGRLVGRRLVREGARVFPRYRTEIAILSSAGFIGTMLSTLVPPSLLGAALTGFALPGPLMPAFFMLLVFLPGLAGMNPIVTVTILGSALAAAPATELPTVVLALSLISGWALAINASPLTASAMILGDLVNRTPHEVTLRWNGGFAFSGYLLLSGWFALLVLVLNGRNLF
ncbi:hypothetical protein [Paracoccus sp. MKU1]|uniref:hypothetical protein n=1 Tax=Paracoccus sp. MKU1 TaxID=1745182 RepID=UPI00071924FA|nr:hypothetical protein [Paracoccus sp. MKU1]KRW95189.1 hypothetical protein AQY21_15785 [Paracoccus sp. MKU1]